MSEIKNNIFWRIQTLIIQTCALLVESLHKGIELLPLSVPTLQQTLHKSDLQMAVIEECSDSFIQKLDEFGATEVTDHELLKADNVFGRQFDGQRVGLQQFYVFY